MPVNTQLIDILRKEEAIPPLDLEHALQQHQKQGGGSLAEWLLRRGLVTEDDLFFLLSRRLGVPAIPEERLLHLTLSPDLRRRVPRALARELVLLPLDLDLAKGTLSVVMFDPSDQEGLKRLRAASRVVEVRTYLARRSVILDAIARAYGATEQVAGELAPVPRMDRDEDSDLLQIGDTQVSLIPGKVELDPSLAKEIAALPEPSPDTVSDDDSQDLPKTTVQRLAAPRGRSVPASAQRPLPTFERRAAPPEIRGRSLLRPGAEAPGLEWTTPFSTPTGQDRTQELDLEQIELSEELSEPEAAPPDPITTLQPAFSAKRGGAADLARLADLTPPLPTLRTLAETEVLTDEHEALAAVPTPAPLQLPGATDPADLEGLLGELLASVGVLVSMLEERIDPGGATSREYAHLSRLMAREIGLDELSVARTALAAHLLGLDVALRRELGASPAADVMVAFSAKPTMPGGLSPSLRTLGAKALGIWDPPEEHVGVQLIRVVADYLELQTESAEDDAPDLETVSQLLRTSGTDPTLVDALHRAVEQAEGTLVRTRKSAVKDS
ncbi:MAG: hypothetical protein IT371_18840 [Deltaproteobacteria bacterium]|nr:hypothetical protein [Deltaproteobacteria bacterium]